MAQNTFARELDRNFHQPSTAPVACVSGLPDWVAENLSHPIITHRDPQVIAAIMVLLTGIYGTATYRVEAMKKGTGRSRQDQKEIICGHHLELVGKWDAHELIQMRRFAQGYVYGVESH